MYIFIYVGKKMYGQEKLRITIICNIRHNFLHKQWDLLSIECWNYFQSKGSIKKRT